MGRRCAVLLAAGFEEIEAVCVIDVLRRAGVDVVVVGTRERSVTGSHGITLVADVVLADLLADLLVADVAGVDVDAVVLPGGLPGATNLRDDANVAAFVKRHHARGAVVAAVCAAPIALARFGVLEGRRATCYPGFESELAGAVVDDASAVVVDGNVITSRGVGTSLAFALALVEHLVDADAARAHARRMLVA